MPAPRLTQAEGTLNLQVLLWEHGTVAVTRWITSTADHNYLYVQKLTTLSLIFQSFTRPTVH